MDPTPYETTLQQIEIVHAMIRRYPDTFQLALTSEDVVKSINNGKLASLMGAEGGHSIENSLEKLQILYDRGVRYMTLTHSTSLDWADSCTGNEDNDGLDLFGEQVVYEMNKMGMVVDLSHVSADTMRDALAVTKAPVMFSHSSALNVSSHVRNVPDDVLESVKANNGVVMVNFYSAFVVPPEEL
jgi:membrane dipeptidase